MVEKDGHKPEIQMISHELFDGLVPHTERHEEIISLAEQRKRDEMVEYMKVLQAGNMRQRSSFKETNLPTPDKKA